LFDHLQTRFNQFDLPLNFHPAAIRASAGGGRRAGGRRRWQKGADSGVIKKSKDSAEESGNAIKMGTAKLQRRSRQRKQVSGDHQLLLTSETVSCPALSG
jgi:hypothetical protein